MFQMYASSHSYEGGSHKCMHPKHLIHFILFPAIGKYPKLLNNEITKAIWQMESVSRIQ